MTGLAMDPRDLPLDALVERARAGDEAAFARVVSLHHADMTRVCFVICGNLDLAEEAVQSAWPIVWRKLGTLRDPERVRPWLVSIAANQARQLIRRQRRRTVVEIAVRGPEPSDDPANRTADLDLANALAGLRPDERALLALRYVAGLTSTELGQALGMTASGTRSRLARVLDKLRSELGDD